MSLLFLAITDASITIKANQLVPGERYTLSVDIISNEKDPTLAVWDITVNYPPYNGSCESMPKIGKSNPSEMTKYCKQFSITSSFSITLQSTILLKGQRYIFR
jgi:hypothetical protein